MTAPLGERELAALVREHTPGLLAVVRAFAEDDGTAEDILQDVWIVAMRDAHRRRSDVPLRGWLYAVALNRARSHRRRARRRAWLSAIWHGAGLEGRAPGHGAGARTIDGELQRAALWRAVAALPSLQREAVILRVVDGLSTREAAERLQRAEGTVKVSLHRGLRTLRALLGPTQEEDV